MCVCVFVCLLLVCVCVVVCVFLVCVYQYWDPWTIFPLYTQQLFAFFKHQLTLDPFTSVSIMQHTNNNNKNINNNYIARSIYSISWIEFLDKVYVFTQCNERIQKSMYAWAIISTYLLADARERLGVCVYAMLS